MKEIQKILRELGIHSTYKGYHYLSTTLEMTLETEHSISLYAKTIFPSVAQKYQSTPSRIERDIRTVIRHCWNCSGRERLQDIAPYTLEKIPTVSEFIDILYWHLRFQKEFSTVCTF